MSRVSAEGILWFERKGCRSVSYLQKRGGGMEYLLYKYWRWLSALLPGLFQNFLANGQSTVYIERTHALGGQITSKEEAAA